jgi:hypothetical protein
MLNWQVFDWFQPAFLASNEPSACQLLVGVLGCNQLCALLDSQGNSFV